MRLPLPRARGARQWPQYLCNRTWRAAGRNRRLSRADVLASEGVGLCTVKCLGVVVLADGLQRHEALPLYTSGVVAGAGRP